MPVDDERQQTGRVVLKTQKCRGQDGKNWNKKTHNYENRLIAFLNH